MGFATPVVGFIKVERNLKAAMRHIQQLPTLSEDHWPFLPKEIFAVAGTEEPLLSYKGEHIIHFGMCVKEADGEWDEWLSKFERLFKAMDAEEAFVMLRHPAWDSGEFGGWFYYRWKLQWPDEVPVNERSAGNREWVFKGGPRRFYGEHE